MGAGNAISIYQTYYDEASRLALDTAYLPLDNSANLRPDWFEFWPMLQFLRQHQLEPDHWYGFLSPRFGEKTGLTAQRVFEFIGRIGDQAEAALFSPAWEQIAYFRNPFEQGEHFAPGLMAAARDFAAAAGLDVDLDRMVSDTETAVFSNYVVAKPVFWAAWLRLATQLFDYAEGDNSAAAGMRRNVPYKNGAVHTKVFMQERLASLVLADGRIRALSIVNDEDQLPASRLPRYLVEALRRCDELKREYRRSGNRELFDAYIELRATLPQPGRATRPAPTRRG